MEARSPQVKKKNPALKIDVIKLKLSFKLLLAFYFYDYICGYVIT